MDIGEILSGLSESDIESLKQTARQLFGGEGENENEKGSGNKSEEKSAEPGGGAPDLSSVLGSAELISKLTSVMGAMNKRSVKSDLIESLKPLLSEKRRKRADEAAQIMRLIDILPLLKGDE